MRIRVFPFFRIENDLSVFPRFECLVGKRAHFDEPLPAQIRLYDGTAAVTVSHRMRYLFFRLKESRLFQIFYYKDARFGTRKRAVFFRTVFIECAVGIQNIYDFKIVALPDLPVIRVMSGRDFYHSRAEFLIDV